MAEVITVEHPLLGSVTWTLPEQVAERLSALPAGQKEFVRMWLHSSCTMFFTSLLTSQATWTSEQRFTDFVSELLGKLTSLQHIASKHALRALDREVAEIIRDLLAR